MKPGEYVVAAFVLIMLSVFFGVYFWYQYKRITKNKRNKQDE
jgi:hypothetical protein